jgi:hypothetical protein
MLYQKGTQRIEVIVKKDGGLSSSIVGAKDNDAENISSQGSQDNDNGSYSFLLGTANKNRKNRVIKTNATHFLAVSKQIIGLEANYLIQGLGQYYGDQSYQEQVARQVEIIQDTSNFASSIAMGVVYGSWGGPLGAILGASMAALSTGASIGVKYAQRRRDFNYKTFKENNTIEYQRARANINLTTGRLR